ncbi:G-patch domain and KOW motifs-containing protein-like [Ostrea edulis]|uniref:G-patch domain and KOW motifs-containing protein-like n=1 Tax=Ostrea edulis TaxID=37623 RepID=UPI0024AEA6B1|nr:G-patch domain and KOW motifs-containing protein-like [Ostrea edulis]
MAGTKPLSFGFSKKANKKELTKSIAAENEKGEDTSTDFVISVDNKIIKGTKPEKEEKKKEYVIPLIKRIKWRKGDNSAKEDADEEEAVKEIIADAAKKNETWEEHGKVDNSDIAIPLLMQNKVPEGFETDEKLDVSLRPSEPEEADYEEVPIEHYGMAMLRGMGWKEGEGIGKNKKNVVAPVAILRPKGLGLGADLSEAKQTQWKGENNLKDKEDEALTMKKGVYCVLTKGSNRDLYGVVIKQKSFNRYNVHFLYLGLSQSQLETVIPKSDGAFVLIVSGKHRGQLGEVMERNRKMSSAAVQLLQDRDCVVNIDFDHICEFVGNIHEQFDY